MSARSVMPGAPLPRLFGWRADRDGELADPFDRAFDLVARDGCGYARRRAGHDDVTCRKLDLLGELRNHLGDVPDHLFEVPVLAHLSVHLEGDAPFLGMADLARRPQRTARSRGVECLADLPRPLLIARSDLQIA